MARTARTPAAIIKLNFMCDLLGQLLPRSMLDRAHNSHIALACLDLPQIRRALDTRSLLNLVLHEKPESEAKVRGFANRLSLPGHLESKTTTPHRSKFGPNRWGADTTSRLIVLFDGTKTTLFQFNRAGSRREASIRRLFISIAVLQITLSIATAQPVTN